MSRHLYHLGSNSVLLHQHQNFALPCSKLKPEPDEHLFFKTESLILTRWYQAHLHCFLVRSYQHMPGNHGIPWHAILAKYLIKQFSSLANFIPSILACLGIYVGEPHHIMPIFWGWVFRCTLYISLVLSLRAHDMRLGEGLTGKNSREALLSETWGVSFWGERGDSIVLGRFFGVGLAQSSRPVSNTQLACPVTASFLVNPSNKALVISGSSQFVWILCIIISLNSKLVPLLQLEFNFVQALRKKHKSKVHL